MTEILLTIKDSKKGKALLDFLDKIDFIEIQDKKAKKSKTQKSISKFPTARINTKSFRFNREEANAR